MATFEDDEGERQTTHFGLKGGSTYIDHGDKTKRKNYIARHRVNENFDDFTSAGSLSRWILWGDHTTLRDNVKEFKERYDLR